MNEKIVFIPTLHVVSATLFGPFTYKSNSMASNAPTYR